MKQVIGKLFAAGILILLAGRVALAAPEYTKLTSVPWSMPTGGAYPLEVIGNVSADQFWILASTPSSTDPNRAACTLYTSNGTDAGTKKLYELFTGRCGTISKDRVYRSGRWYFGMTKLIPSRQGDALVDPEGEELWVVGSDSASEIIINPGSEGSSPGAFYTDGPVVYFAATTKTHGRELWTTSGTQDSTELFKDINPGAASSNPAHIVYFNNFRYFAANDGVHGTELWRTSGLSSRVELFKDINPKAGVGSDISALFPYNGLLFISANDGAHSQNLWATTGFPQLAGSTAPSETALFKDLYIQKTINPNGFFVDSGKLHFLSDTLAADGTLQSVLWQSDGTAQGTSIKYTFPGSAKYIGSAGPAGLAFNFVSSSTRDVRGIIVGAAASVVQLGQAYNPRVVNHSYYFMSSSVWPSGVFRYDPYAVPALELITTENAPASSKYIFDEVVASSATHAIMRGEDRYFSVVDMACSSGVKKNPGQCGCFISDVDTDSDRTPDCVDGCPKDSGKTAAGICGCGTSDRDSDSDGTADCKDGCVYDPAKLAPGVCGCGVSDADTDGDGTADCKDLCPNDAKKVTAGACGCGKADVDSDGDRRADCQDDCPADALKWSPGWCGCGTSDVDTDYDGTPDCHDACSNDRSKTQPGSCGCGVSDNDADRDGVADCQDKCPTDARKMNDGACGCGVADVDSDGDGSADCIDSCPKDAGKQSPGACGCGKPDVDSDADGTADCKDICRNDSSKVAPGVCGCGVSDADADGDGVVDCKDKCPADPKKAAAGSCGCGVSDADADGDGTADCTDQCPTDARKKAPGACGCGVADQDLNRDRVPDCIQIAELTKAPGAPTVQVGKKSVTITVPAASQTALPRAKYNVSYRFQTAVKGRTNWSRGAVATSSKPTVKIQKPKSAQAIRVYYQVAIPGLPTASPQSAEVEIALN